MHFEKIKPILEELDNICPADKPVLIHSHLVPLFKKHANLSEIDLIPRNGREILGLHLSIPAKNKLVIYHKNCAKHDPNEVEPSCPDCQMMRFVIAKELVHALDDNGHKTPPDAAAASLIDQLVRRAWRESPQAAADGWGEIWACELLVRYRSRLAGHGGGVMPPGFVLSQARANKDYSYIARQFCVPQYVAEHVLGDNYMASMKDYRAMMGLPIQFD